MRCNVDECVNLSDGGARGMCPKHYKRSQRNGTTSDSGLTRRPAGSRGNTPCRADGCESTESRQWTPYCSKHGSRVSRHGDPTVTRQAGRKAFEGLPTEPSLHCIVCERSNARGYGRYRYVFVRQFGYIPIGAQIDHRCRVTSCVNPEHMEAVTPLDNTRRRAVAMRYEKVHGKQDAEFWLLWDWSQKTEWDEGLAFWA